MKQLKFIFLLLILKASTFSYAALNKIKSISIEGNKRVGSQAIFPLIGSQKNKVLDKNQIRKDILKIHKLGYFSTIDVYKEEKAGDLHLIYALKEKSSIRKISFTGLNELSKDSVLDELHSKMYTILDEQKIALDLSIIEKKYQEKGFFLVDISYHTKKINEHESELIFAISENGKILVGEVNILGNQFFSDSEILSKFMSQPYSNMTAINSRSLYNRDFVTRDVEFLSYYYKDHGFSDVRVSTPVIHIDRDKSFARITLRVEEGSQYYVDSISVGGDIGPDLYTSHDLLKDMNLKAGELFKISELHKDISFISDMYGDLGYAYADINPIPLFNKEKKTVGLHFEIAKGKKVYFANINIKGNSKTRVNVIMREMEVHDSELYSGTKLAKSKRNIQRLGYFEELKFQKKPSQRESDMLDLDISVKEKSTGELQASVGFSPGGKTSETWFAQGRYSEKNQFGRGWSLGLEGRWSGSDNLLGKVSFSNPRVFDSQWYLGGSFSYDSKMIKYAADYESQDKEIKFEGTVGRTIFELVRGFLTYAYSINKPHEENIFLPSTEKIIASSITLKISRYDLDNLLEPTEGLGMSISHKFVGGFLQGNQKYMETEAEISYYIPLDFTETYRTHFRFNLVGGHLWKAKNESLPYSARYRLGGYYDLRGYYFGEVSPVERRASSPTESSRDYYKGGDRKLYAQIEYFIPIIKEANIKGLLFFDTGMVYEEEEPIDLGKFKSDLGFGFRWKTPIAPFRFEWAYPIDFKEGKLGDMKFIFSLGY